MNKKLRYLFLFIASGIVLSNNSYAQVNTMPFTSALDTFAIITGTTVDMQGQDDIAFNRISRARFNTAKNCSCGAGRGSRRGSGAV